MQIHNIRVARPEEYEAIGDITVQAYLGLGPEESAVIDDYFDELRDTAKRTESAEVIVAVDENGKVLGSVTLVLDDQSELAEWEEKGVGGFRMLAVHPEVQGLGVGRVLTEYCIERTRDAGKSAVVLHTREVMKAAHKIYQSYGFKRCERLDLTFDDIHLMGYRLELR